MASTNREPSAAPATTSHGLVMQHQQQQELIKLLAQHFHHQFYQLTNNSTNAGTTGLSRSQVPPTLATVPSAYPQHHGQFQDDPLLAANRFDLSKMNHLIGSCAQSNTTNPPIFSNHLQAIHRSHQLLASGRGSSINVNPESFASNFASQSAINPDHALGDVNLFNALGLNLTSNQLVLSLQQQSILQAAAAAAAASKQQQQHFNESRNQYDDQQRSRDLIEPAQHLSDHEATTTDSKEHLKFSINTILGKGSPKSYNTSGLGLSMTNQILTNKRDAFGEQQTREEQSNSDCDPTGDFGSDSSSMHTPTPVSQSNTSISFSNPQLVSVTDHRSASNLNAFPNSDQPQLRHHQHSQAHGPHHNIPFLASSTAFPWTVAARGKPRRGMMRRAVFSDGQRVGLEKRFQLQKYISKPDRKKLAEKLGLRDSQVKIWFQNRRMKWRNSKERELLSAGGSREQTLPTRNNPNPDLSDVGETIKRMTSTTATTNGGQVTETSLMNK